MRLLYHHPLSPGSRKVRLALGEKGAPVTLREERVWDHRPEFMELNPAGEVPVLVEEDGTVLSGATAIVEYLDDINLGPSLMPREPRERAEVRRIVDWFDRKFAVEVSDAILYERVEKRFISAQMGGGAPDMEIVRTAMHNLRYHLDYVAYLIERRRWLSGETLTIADLTAAAHLSCMDYVGGVPWDAYPGAKDWYVRLKSRPGFRPLLADALPGMAPPRSYANLDF